MLPEKTLEPTRLLNTWKNNIVMAEKLGIYVRSIFQISVYRQTLYCVLFMQCFGLKHIRNLFGLAMNFNFEPHCKEANATAFINTNCAVRKM